MDSSEVYDPDIYLSNDVLRIIELYGGWPDDTEEVKSDPDISLLSGPVRVLFKARVEEDNWRTQRRDRLGRWTTQWDSSLPTDPFGESAFVASKPPPTGGSKTRYTVSPHGDGYAIFDNGEFHSAPESGTWGAAKKIANRLNDSIRDVKMKYQPQLAKDGGTVFHHGPDWIVERKWDGLRAVFEITPDETKIFSRTGQDLRPQFPELTHLHETLPPSILDGEILALDKNGQDDLEKLQLRAGDKQARRKDEIPVSVKFFDVLESGDKSTLDLPMKDRKAELEKLVGKDYMIETLPEDFKVEDIPKNWEGTMSKLKNSKYEVGKRRASWMKYKLKKSATLRVTGLTPGLGSRKSSFGAVTVADANGVPRGQIGSGFTQDDINTLLEAQKTGNWPLIEVEYRFLSKTGLLTNTAYKGIRHDKDEADILGKEGGADVPKVAKNPASKIAWWEKELDSAKAAGDVVRVKKAEAKLVGLRKYAADQGISTVVPANENEAERAASESHPAAGATPFELSIRGRELSHPERFATQAEAEQAAKDLAASTGREVRVYDLRLGSLASPVHRTGEQSTKPAQDSEVLARLKNNSVETFATLHRPKTFSGWKLHLNMGGDLEKEAQAYELLRPLVEDQGMGLKLATSKFQELVAGGHPQAGKDITIYLPRRSETKDHAQKIIDAIGGLTDHGAIKNDDMLAPGVGLRFEFKDDTGADVPMEDYQYHYAAAGDSPNIPLPDPSPGPESPTTDRIVHAFKQDPSLLDTPGELAWRLYEEDEAKLPGEWDITSGGIGKELAISEYTAEIDDWLASNKPAKPKSYSKSVYESVSYRPDTEAKLAKNIKDALAAIDSVHSMPKSIGEVPVRQVSGTDDLGKYRYHKGTNRPVSIDLNYNENGANVTLAHEIGHFLDHWGFNPDLRDQGKWSTSTYKSAAIYQVISAAQDSRGFQKLKSWQRRDPEYYDYMASNKEVFARAYAQWISLRSGKLKGVKSRVGQWSDEDFQPIAEAMDALFAEKGLLKEQKSLPANPAPDVLELAAAATPPKVEYLTGNAANSALDVDKIEALKKITPEGKQAMWDYGEHAQTVNYWLRHGPFDSGFATEDVLKAKNMTSAIKVSKTSKPVHMMRGVEYPAELFGTSDFESLVGETWFDPGFVSTTTDKDIADSFAGKFGGYDSALLEIDVPAGTPAFWMGAGNESELVLQRGSKFIINKVDLTPGETPVFHVELVPQTDAEWAAADKTHRAETKLAAEKLAAAKAEALAKLDPSSYEVQAAAAPKKHQGISYSDLYSAEKHGISEEVVNIANIHPIKQGYGLGTGVGPLVARKNGELYMIDGQNAVIEAERAGESTLKVRMLELTPTVKAEVDLTAGYEGEELNTLIKDVEQLVADRKISKSDTYYSITSPYRRSEAALSQVRHITNRNGGDLESAIRALDSQTKWQGGWAFASDEWNAASAAGGSGSMSKGTRESTSDDSLSDTDFLSFQARREWHQAEFRRLYGDELVVYRGVTGGNAIKPYEEAATTARERMAEIVRSTPIGGDYSGGVSDEIEAPQYQLSSWSTHSYTASQFAFGVKANGRVGNKKGVVLQTTIKAEDVWLLPRSGVESVIRIADASGEIVLLNPDSTRKVKVQGAV